jgi:RNA polymerase sigma-70 factor (ECF subfamily)
MRSPDAAVGPDPSSEVDAQIVRRMAAGDPDALGSLYDRWAGRVQSLAVSIVRSVADAEEVVEETFWQAWQQAARFDASRGSVAAWLLTIARSRALDLAKAQRRRREDVSDEAGSTLVSDRPDPAQHAVASEERSLVASALAALPHAQREAVEMAYFGGLSQTEIAACTGQPLGTVKTRLRLAMHKLRERLAPVWEVA